MSNVLGIGHSGLAAAKKQMATTAHNISNVNTEGYTRQRAEQQANRPVGRGNLVMGTGVDVSSVKRIHDELVDKKLYGATTEGSFHDERSFHLGQLEEIFNEANGEGLNKVLNDFFNTFRELSTNPDNESLKSVVRDQAQLVTQDFRRISNRLEEIERNLEGRLRLYVQDVNHLLDNVAHLNIKITELEIAGGETGDLRDQRDVAIKSLSEYFELETFTNERNQCIVNVVGAGPIVAGGTVQHLQATVGKINGNTLAPSEENQLFVFFENKTAFNLADKFKKGKMQGIFETHQTEVKNTRESIDNIAYNLVMATNTLHRKGYINTKLPLDENGQLDSSKYKAITGINFFNEPTEKQGAAAKIDLSSLVKEDPIYIAAAAAPNSPGDNRVALSISKLQHERFFNNNTSSFEDEYLKNVGSLGLASSKSQMNADQSKGIIAQIKTLRERVSGVSLDEEATNMMQFQQAYEASAKVMKASDDMFNSLMSLFRS